MRVTLVRPLPDLNRWSMDLYSDQLVKALRSQAGARDEISIFPAPETLAAWQSDIRKPSGKCMRWLQQYFLMGPVVHKINSDIIHITDNGYANLIPFLKGRRVVVTFHDALLPSLANLELPVSWKPRTSIWAQAYAIRQLKKAGHIIAVSDFSRNELIRHGSIPAEKISTVYEAAGSAFFKPASNEEKRLFLARWNLSGKLIILLPGRSYPHKNIEGSLQAFAVLIKRLSTEKDPMLLKIGSPLTPEQQDLAQSLGIGAKIRVLENIPSAEIPLVYQISHAVIFLSFYEGFGLPVLEAMASGVPILISNRGSLPEISGGNALIADPENIEACSESLLRIVSDIKLRQELIDKGMGWVKKFSWQETAKRTWELYEKISAESYDKKMD